MKFVYDWYYFSFKFRMRKGTGLAEWAEIS